jgi:haloalkane dehalogenase
MTPTGDKPFRNLIAGAQGQPHTTIDGAGHFFQEDKGPELAQLIVDFIAANPVDAS